MRYPRFEQRGSPRGKHTATDQLKRSDEILYVPLARGMYADSLNGTGASEISGIV